MKFDLNRVAAIDFLIRHESTGSPVSFARRLNISKRTLHMTLAQMKEMFKAPIEYDRQRLTYYYAEHGHISILFQKSKPPLNRQLFGR